MPCGENGVVNSDEEFTGKLKGKFYNLGLELPVVGDYVKVITNEYGDALIDEVLPRTTAFKRPNRSGHAEAFVKNLLEETIVANFDYVFIVTSLNQNYNENRIARYVSITLQTGAKPVVILSKADLCDDVELKVEITKAICEKADVVAIWNKGSFACTMNYVFRVTSPWAFFCALVEYGRSVNAFSQARKEAYWFELIDDFVGLACEQRHSTLLAARDCSKNGTDAPLGTNRLAGIVATIRKLDKNLIYDLLRYDFVRTGKKGNFPAWYKHNYDKDKHRKLLEENGMLENTRIGFAITEYEEFDYNVLSEKPEAEKKRTEILIRYK